MKPNKNGCVIFFKCLDDDQMVKSRIYISKVIDLSKMLFSTVHFAPIWWMGKSIQNTWFLVTLINVDQLQGSGSCIWIFWDWIWMGKIRVESFCMYPSACVCVGVDLIFGSDYICVCIEREKLVSFWKDSRPNSSHSNTILQHLNVRSAPLKLIYIISCN